MQAGGNFVLDTADNGVLWASDTGAAGSTLELQDDRNLVIYGAGRKVVWSPTPYITESENRDGLMPFRPTNAGGNASAEANPAHDRSAPGRPTRRTRGLFDCAKHGAGM